jgi:nucleoside-diphosphate-sugar epimerase
VGSNVARQQRFDDTFRSTNIESIAGKAYDLIVCAGAPAEKWKANQDPAADRRCLDRLWAGLGAAQAKKVVLISTVDVYARPIDVDEDADVDRDRSTPYGCHRHDLEERVVERFDSLIVRLPGLFAEGLKKNVVFDFLHGNGLDKIDARSIYQFYCLDYLWCDIAIALGSGLRVLNVASEPISVRDVAREAFGFLFENELTCEPSHYDVRSKHDRLYRGAGGYLYSQSQVLRDLRYFVAKKGGQARCA